MAWSNCPRPNRASASVAKNHPLALHPVVALQGGQGRQRLRQVEPDLAALAPVIVCHAPARSGQLRLHHLLARQQVVHKRRVDAVVALIRRRAERVPAQVIGQRAQQVLALPLHLPHPLVDRAALAQRFLQIADRAHHRVHLVQDLLRPAETVRHRQVGVLVGAQRMAQANLDGLVLEVGGDARFADAPEQTPRVAELVELLQPLRQRKCLDGIQRRRPQQDLGTRDARDALVIREPARPVDWGRHGVPPCSGRDRRRRHCASRAAARQQFGSSE